MSKPLIGGQQPHGEERKKSHFYRQKKQTYQTTQEGNGDSSDSIENNESSDNSAIKINIGGSSADSDDFLSCRNSSK